MQTEGIERRLQAVVNGLVRASRKLALVAAVFGLAAWLIVRSWFDPFPQVVVLICCLAPGIAAFVVPILVRRVHRQAKELIGALRGYGAQAQALLPRLDEAVDRFREARRWSRFQAGRVLLRRLNEAGRIVTGVGMRATDIQAAGMMALWAFALGFIGLLVLIFTLPLLAIAQLLF